MARTALFWLLTVLWVSPLAAQDWAQKMFEVDRHDFGSIARDSKAEFAFVLKNSYVEDIHIARVHSSCGCTTPRIAKQLLKTYERGAIIAHINTDRFIGRKGATITVTFDKPYYATARLHVDANIRSDVVFNPGSVQFGNVQRGTAAERTVTVTGPGGRWQIVDVKSTSPHVSARIAEAGQQYGRAAYQLVVCLDENVSLGYFKHPLMLVTNDPRSPQIALTVEGTIESGISISPASLFLGVLAPGDKVTKQVVVRGKQPFRIVGITSDGGRCQFAAPPEDVARPLHLVPVTFVAGPNPGKIVEMIHIETDLGEPVPEVSAHAVVSRPDEVALDSRP